MQYPPYADFLFSDSIIPQYGKFCKRISAFFPKGRSANFLQSIEKRKGL